MSAVDYDLMTPAEVAAAFRIDRNTCYAWRAKGEGPASFKVGRSVRYRRRDVQAWLDAQASLSARGGQVA